MKTVATVGENHSEFLGLGERLAIGQSLVPEAKLESNEEAVETKVEEGKDLAPDQKESAIEVAVEMATKERGKKKKAQKPKKVVSAELAALLKEGSAKSLELALFLARQMFEEARLKLSIKEKLEQELGKKEGSAFFKEHLEQLGEYGKCLKAACCVVLLYDNLAPDLQALIWENLGSYTWDEWKRLLQLPEKQLLAAFGEEKHLSSPEIKTLSYSYVAKKFPSDCSLNLTKHHLDVTRKAYSELKCEKKWDLLLQKISELALGGDEYTEHLFEALESFGLAPDKVRQTKRSSPGQKIQELNSLLEQQKQDTSSKLDEIAKLIKHLQQENLWLKQQFNSINNNSAFEKSAVA